MEKLQKRIVKILKRFLLTSYLLKNTTNAFNCVLITLRNGLFTRSKSVFKKRSLFGTRFLISTGLAKLARTLNTHFDYLIKWKNRQNTKMSILSTDDIATTLRF